MASLPPIAAAPRPVPDPNECRRVGPALRDDALAVLLTGRNRPNDPAVRQFLNFAVEQGLDLTELWAGWDGKRLSHAALLVPGVGKTAMMFLGPIASAGQLPLAGRLVHAAISNLDTQRYRLVQALLDPGQGLQQDALLQGGFTFLAELIYMHRSGRPLPDPLIPSLDGRRLKVTTWSEEARPEFAQAIAASYEGTLDCPGLLGLRDMNDIIAGHMATGRFDPDCWSVYQDDDGRPAAVLLLAEATNRNGFELVYVGLAPHARGKGLAKTLMHMALDTAARKGRGSGQLYLAVDQHNAPAVALYRGLGFRDTARKLAYIHCP